MSEKTTKLFSKINSMALILFAFIFLAVSSCELEIGLGASVDTEPPTIEITLPSTSANSIRGSFPIKGKCFDDGVVNVVTLTVKETGKTNADPIVFKYERTEKDKADSTNTITLSEKDTLWECFLDPNVTYQTSGGNDATLKDGSYEAVVEIADLLGHTATDKVIFTVDNTPPILVLQRPSSKDGDLSLDSFGQELSIEGQAYDASDVKRIEVKIFQNDGTGWKLWDTAVLENVPPTVDMTVMKWTPAQDEKYIDKSYDKGGYKDLYGDDQYAGDKQYRCEIVAYDDALPCPNEGEGAGYGNKAEFYYLYEDIYSSVLSEGYKLTQIYSMMNGTDTETAADKIKTVLDTLKSNEVKDGGSFTLNPLNNPTYSISGYDAANKDDVNVFDFDKNNVVIGSVITVKISSGLDQIPLKNDSIGISLVEIDPADPVTKNDKGDITGIKAKKKADGKDEVIRVFKTKDEWDESKDGNRDDKIKKLGNLDRTVSLTLSKDDDKFPDLKTGAYYALKVDVKDEKGNDGDNNGIIYGFRLISTGSGPTINDAKVETTPANDEKNVNSTGSIKITADVSYTEKITMALYLDEVKKENKVDGDFKTVGGKYVWENNDLETLFNSTEGSKNFVIVANADDGTSAKVERRVTYDKTAPTIQINSPKDNTGESAIINKQPTFRGTVFDTGTSVKAVYYAIKNKVETAPTVPAANNDVDESVWKKTTGKESWTISLENSPIDEGNYVLYLFAEDGAYNRTELVKEEFDVDTKLPTVKTEIGSTVIPDSKLNTQTASYGLKITVEDTYKVDENAPEVVVDKDSET